MRRLRLSAALVLLITGMALLSGCQPVPPSPPAAPNQVVITNYAFFPNTLEIAQGTTVTWTNNDSDIHTLTAKDGAFDSGYIGIGGTFSYTFNQSGTFEYDCFIHPTMQPGKIIVDLGTGPLPESKAVLSPKTVAELNLAGQLLLVIMVLGAAYLARKKKLNFHCAVIRVAIFFQATSIILVMFPGMLAHLERGRGGLFFNAEIIIHALLGLAIIVIFILVNLVFTGIARLNVKLVLLMRVALVLWLVTFLIGWHLFLQSW